MAIPFDRNAALARELLAKHRNRKAAIITLTNQGMDGEEAAGLVQAIYKENLSSNRKSFFVTMIGGGMGTAIFLGIYFGTGRLFYIWLPLCGISFLYGLVRFLTASGYEVDPD